MYSIEDTIQYGQVMDKWFALFILLCSYELVICLACFLGYFLFSFHRYYTLYDMYNGLTIVFCFGMLLPLIIIIMKTLFHAGSYFPWSWVWCDCIITICQLFHIDPNKVEFLLPLLLCMVCVSIEASLRSHYRHYPDLSERIGHIKCLAMYIISSVGLRLSSLLNHLLCKIWSPIFRLTHFTFDNCGTIVLHFITIIKSKHYPWLGHETMVCAVCLA